MTSENRLPLRALWGSIQAGVRERLSTADLWRRANEAAVSRGFTGVSGNALEMGQLRSVAARVRNAAETFGRAALNQAIDPTMFAPDINIISSQHAEVAPMYRVRYLQQVRTIAGESISTFRTSSFPVQLPGTKAALLAELEANANVMAETYGEEHQGISDIEISVV